MSLDSNSGFNYKGNDEIQHNRGHSRLTSTWTSLSLISLNPSIITPVSVRLWGEDGSLEGAIGLSGWWVFLHFILWQWHLEKKSVVCVCQTEHCASWCLSALLVVNPLPQTHFGVSILNGRMLETMLHLKSCRKGWYIAGSWGDTSRSMIQKGTKQPII